MNSRAAPARRHGVVTAAASTSRSARSCRPTTAPRDCCASTACRSGARSAPIACRAHRQVPKRGRLDHRGARHRRAAAADPVPAPGAPRHHRAGRVGGIGANGSGDIFLAFATGNHVRARRGGCRCAKMLAPEQHRPRFPGGGGSRRGGDPERAYRRRDDDGGRRPYGARAAAGSPCRGDAALRAHGGLSLLIPSVWWREVLRSGSERVGKAAGRREKHPLAWPLAQIGHPGAGLDDENFSLPGASCVPGRNPSPWHSFPRGPPCAASMFCTRILPGCRRWPPLRPARAALDRVVPRRGQLRSQRAAARRRVLQPYERLVAYARPPLLAGACLGVLAWLVRWGRRVVNGPGALDLEISKVRQYAASSATAFRRRGPSWWPGATASQRRCAHFRVTGDPEAEPGRQGAGRATVPVRRSLDAYLAGAAYEARWTGMRLLQEYIRAQRPVITRAEFVGGRFLYAVEVDTSDGFELARRMPARSATPTARSARRHAQKFTIIDGIPIVAAERGWSGSWRAPVSRWRGSSSSRTPKAALSSTT